jgi:hypothetical protein
MNDCDKSTHFDKPLDLYYFRKSAIPSIFSNFQVVAESVTGGGILLPLAADPGLGD